MCSRKTNWNKQVLEYVVIYIPGMFIPLFTEHELSGRLQVFWLHNRDLHPVEIMARFQPLSLVLNVDHCTFSIYTLLLRYRLYICSTFNPLTS